MEVLQDLPANSRNNLEDFLELDHRYPPFPAHIWDIKGANLFARMYSNGI
jgi:hypothetical protein